MVNERIKLPAQEWLGYDPEKGDLHGYTVEQMREFAEMIVRECIELCDKEHAHSIHTHAGPWNTAIKRCQESIATHFGVEE